MTVNILTRRMGKLARGDGNLDELRDELSSAV